MSRGISITGQIWNNANKAKRKEIIDFEREFINLPWNKLNKTQKDLVNKKIMDKILGGDCFE